MGAFRFHVSGRVQGVGFRYFVLREAERLGITGYTRNLPDGRVEVVAEGSDEAIDGLQAALHRGPAFASVADVARSPIDPRGDEGFHIR